MKYSVRIPISTCLDGKKFAQYLERLLPEGCRINDEDRATWNAILAYSFAKEFYPSYEKDFYVQDGGSWYRGKHIATFHGEIVGERRTELNETIYRVRANGRYFDLSFDDLLRGRWASLVGPNEKILDPTQLFAEMRREFANRSEVELKRFAIEELDHRKAEIQRQIDEKLGGAK